MKKIFRGGSAAFLVFSVVLLAPGAAVAFPVPAADPAQDTAPAPDHSPVLDRGQDGRWIVAVGPPTLGLSTQVAARAARTTGGTVLHTYEHAFQGFAIEGASAKELAAIPGVVSVEPDLRVQAFAQTLPTGVDRIEADQNAVANINGSDERVDADVAVIDTGVDLDHPDLNVVSGVDCTKGPDCSRGGDGDDDNGHGTHVAGIIGALDNSEGVVGVAPGVGIWPVKVLKRDGSGFLSDVIEGIDYVTANAADIEVANMSLGGTGTSDAFRTAIANSVNAGVVYVVAAGNSGKDVYGDDGVFGTSDDIIPAAYPEVAAISAFSDTDGQPGGNGPLSWWGGDDINSDGVDDGEDDSFAFFSNFSASVVADNPVTSPGAAIDLLLPGVDILSTWKDGEYNTISGTSMASPHGAGLAALYIAENGRATDAAGVSAIRQALIDGGLAQDGADGLTHLNDPDSHWEHLGWASSAVGDPPTVAVTNPLDGATVSGTIDITADASDPDGSVTQVEFFVDSASIAADTDGSDGWSASWDSTTVSDGSHSISAEATDNDGNTASDSVTVEVDNVDDLPEVALTDPADGDTVSGAVTVTADASDDRGVSQVEFFVDASSIGVDTDGSDGWSASWDTTAYADGDHNVTAEATDTASQTASHSITVTVNNSGGSASDMYVWKMTWSEKHRGKGGAFTDVMVTVDVNADSDADGVAEAGDDPTANASSELVLTHDTDGDGLFEPGTDDDSWIFGGNTSGEGKITFTLKFAPDGDYQAEVTGLTHDTLTWDSALDADNPDWYFGVPNGSE